ncbi:MAG TPA: vWA domain-containing protein [Saprospiraceae bacterium]|nr:vWA domain-containing protein [Saprospiraceae bacterium]
MMKIFKYLSVLSLIFLIGSCGKNGVDPKNPKSRDFELFIDFWNTQGTNPQITFDAVNSSPEIKIDFSKTFAGITVPPKYTNVIIDNVRIIDENDINYEINGITAYEWREDIDDWKVDVEFTMNYTQVQDLLIMMVLDASASLGTDFDKVKVYAANFVTKVLTDIPNARIGVIDFSDEIHSFPPTNNRAAILNYIASLEQGPFTSLYEAVNMGIDFLDNGNAEGKALLVFTDGTDNNSDPEFTPAYLLDKLDNSAATVGINSFTIGLEGNGGVDKPVLEALAANSGSVAFPENIDELGNVFEKFSSSIANVYNLTYIRNQQVIPATNKARLRFVIKGTAKTD